MEFENPPPTGNIEFDVWAQRLVETLRTQPAFLVTNSGAQSNIPTGGSFQTIVLDSEIYDANEDFASNTFTAPVTGYYQLSLIVKLDPIDITASFYGIGIITSNRTYKQYLDTDMMISTADQDWAFCATLSIMADMDKGDTAYAAVQQSGGLAQTDIAAGDAFFSGFIVR